MIDDLKILYEDKYILVLNKPSGVATQTRKIGEKDLCSMVKNYLDGGYVGLINRLDQQVEGLVLMAKSSGMAAILTEQLNADKLEKNYQARVYIAGDLSGVMSDSYVRLKNHMHTDKTTNVSRICDPTVHGAKIAELEYKMVDVKMEEDHSIADLDIRLLTGRHHQIRLQLSHIGMPILGDTKYGTKQSIEYSMMKGIKNIELKAYRLKFAHPATGVDMTFTI